MIDINELRRLTQAALAGPDGISLNWIKLLQDFQQKVSPAAVFELLDRLEAAEKSDAESIAMYRNARDARDDLRAKIESTWRAIEARTTGAQPAANFADAYQGAMEEVAIWKKRALEAENLNRKFVAEINGPTYMGEPAHPKPDCGEAGHDEGRCGNRQCLPGAQPAPSAPSEEAAAEMGANGGHVVEAERLAFEAWMRGHCWKLGAKWTGTEYRSAFEKGGMVDMHAMRTRELWAAWRDRAALAAAPEAKP